MALFLDKKWDKTKCHGCIELVVTSDTQISALKHTMKWLFICFNFFVNV